LNYDYCPRSWKTLNFLHILCEKLVLRLKLHL
jgi:hypothetical protein